MERRFLRRLLLPTLLIMLCIQVFAAQEQSAAPMRIDPEPGFTTCIEDTDGNTITRNGVPNTNALAEFGHAAQIDSYSIYYNGRLLMTVTPVGFSAPDTAVMSIGGMPACSGFYKTTFSVDETREIFLTGLTESTLEQVQNELTASALEDRYFNLTNVDFIDAEQRLRKVRSRRMPTSAGQLLRPICSGSAAGEVKQDFKRRMTCSSRLFPRLQTREAHIHTRWTGFLTAITGRRGSTVGRS